MLTRVRPDLPLALGLLDGRPACVVFAVIIRGEIVVCFSPHQFLCFTTSLRSSDSCFALRFSSTFPSSLVRFRRRRHRSGMGKPKKSASAVGTSAAGGKKGAAAARVTDGGWRRSETRESDLRKLRERSLIPQDATAVRLPGNEVIPRPPSGYRVMFVAFVLRGFSYPVHDFLRGLLFFYGVQLHHLSPNSLLHIACFITLCECWLGIEPHFGLFQKLYSVRRQSGSDGVYPIGGFIISLSPDVQFFSFSMSESVQYWRRKWFYIRDSVLPGQDFGLVPFDPSQLIVKKRSWKNQILDGEVAEIEALYRRVEELQLIPEKEVNGVDIIRVFLERRVQPLQATPPFSSTLAVPKV
ncbi:MAG: hypothetical protein JF625_24255 [Inquilinus limosus]|uniref:Transposase (putative) gypsy type domain-containing protein n=1 Tax=Inquilinus limosus TaxID=171674 RepID=A0A952KFG5_9PROT|nr:hypothetical protein [Inquilinus limosus]